MREPEPAPATPSQQSNNNPTMPKVRTGRTKKAPEGWELIEPTLTELQQKMKEGKL